MSNNVILQNAVRKILNVQRAESAKSNAVAGAAAAAFLACAAPSYGGDAARYDLQIDRQPLSSALQEFAKQSGVQIIFFASLTDGQEAPSLKGKYTAADALQRLLNDSSLTFHELNAKTIEVQPVAAANDSKKVLGSSLVAPAPTGEAGTSMRLTQSSTSPSTGTGEGAQRADEAQSPSPSNGEGRGEEKLQEVVVTATRRRQTLEEVPYSITAMSADEIARTGVRDVASLANQVPGLAMFDIGARYSASTFPIIRGLNASNGAGGIGIRTLNQAPVGIYLGNSPVQGYFQLDDVQRIEVLRGPQGTLYGAGALGGALRIIPNAPELGQFAGNLEAGAGTLAHSGRAGYTTSAMLNIPIGDTLAFRATGKYVDQPGFIDVYGLLERPGSQASGIPVLANPADPVNSPGIITGKSDWNHQNTFTGRASVLWKPVEQFNAELAFTSANLNGDGGPLDNPVFAGGPYPIDPRFTFPQGGDYRGFAAVDQPYSGRTNLTSLDLSYDAGFATVSSTSSYYTTNSSITLDTTYGLAALPGFVGYYAGNPVNPRFVNPSFVSNSAHTFTQEVRLVSATGPDKKFDYVVGVFYEKQETDGTWDYANPGSPEYSAAEGCTAPYFGGASFPNCLVVSGPGDVHFHQADAQHFEDKSVFGELTWHFATHGQITFGGRHFQQSFTDAQAYLLYPFGGIFLPAVPTSSQASKNTWKINPSYEYATHQYVYAIWSQGFRRGGANALPTVGFFRENPALVSYAPDSVNNYEAGLKGRFANGLSYTVDAFDVQWDKPQVAGGTPIGNLAVWNANKAESKGFEFDLSGPLLVSSLGFRVGAAYADAKFTQDYSYSANNGAGTLVPGLIYGKNGQQLPGSPKVSAAATVTYDRNLAPNYDLTVSLNDTYRSTEVLSTFPSAYGGLPLSVPGMNLANLSATVRHGSWRLGAYVTNLTDRRVILGPPEKPPHGPNTLNDLTSAFTINSPREVYLRLGYSF